MTDINIYVDDNANELMKRFGIKSYHQIYHWYVNNMHLYTFYKNKECRLRNYIQHGGVREKINDELITLKNGNKAKLSLFKVTDENEEVSELYLMAPENTDRVKRCILVKIDKDSTIADIGDVNIYFK